jgi:hypothetical protein
VDLFTIIQESFDAGHLFDIITTFQKGTFHSLALKAWLHSNVVLCAAAKPGQVL